MYKLYENPMDRLKESLGLTRKKRYKEHYALNNVSFQVKKGETVGIIGTNGSGKSTILKIITGVLNPTQGEVVVDGRISALLELSRIQRRVFRYRKRVSERSDDRIQQRRDRCKTAGYPGFCRYRRFYPPTGKNVFQWYVCAIGFCGSY